MNPESKNRKLFLPIGIISLSLLLPISSFYIFNYLQNNQKYVIEMYVISNLLWDENFYGLENRGIIQIDSLAFSNRDFKELFANKDTINYISYKFPEDVTYGDFVRFMNIIRKENLECALYKDNIIIWYENPKNPSWFNQKFLICGTYRLAHPVYQSSPEIDYNIFFNSWGFWIIIIAWISLIVLNILKLKKLFKFSS